MTPRLREYLVNQLKVLAGCQKTQQSSRQTACKHLEDLQTWLSLEMDWQLIEINLDVRTNESSSRALDGSKIGFIVHCHVPAFRNWDRTTGNGVYSSSWWKKERLLPYWPKPRDYGRLLVSFHGRAQSVHPQSLLYILSRPICSYECSHMLCRERRSEASMPFFRAVVLCHFHSLIVTVLVVRFWEYRELKSENLQSSCRNSVEANFV